MPFVEANLDKEKKELEKLVATDVDAAKAHGEFLAKLALQQQLISSRKAENLTQQDVARAAGLSQQAVSRIEKGSGATINSLIKYLTGIGYSIELKKV
ncbi:MAG: helix-turn-helix domain-containing protein [Oxalobacter sp.]|nr:helix-turn-helix domain-containing protein [Oxalobacter sp.]